MTVAPMASQFPLAEVVTVISGLMILAIAAVSYMRAVNILGDLIRNEKPGLALRYYYFSFWLICGLSSYNVQDTRYPELLRRARQRMIFLTLVFVALIVAIGWFSRA